MVATDASSAPESAPRCEARVCRAGEWRGDRDHAADSLVWIEAIHRVLADQAALAMGKEQRIAQALPLDRGHDEASAVRNGA